jgi:hypothetical protein
VPKDIPTRDTPVVQKFAQPKEIQNGDAKQTNYAKGFANKYTYVREWKKYHLYQALLRRPGRGVVGTHHGEILGFSKETENVLWQVFQPRKNLAIGEGE